MVTSNVSLRPNDVDSVSESLPSLRVAIEVDMNVQFDSDKDGRKKRGMASTESGDNMLVFTCGVESHRGALLVLVSLLQGAVLTCFPKNGVVTTFDMFVHIFLDKFEIVVVAAS